MKFISRIFTRSGYVAKIRSSLVVLSTQCVQRNVQYTHSSQKARRS